MKNRVITISREFGSGGRTIDKKVAEKLGIPCYDAEIIQEMAKETGFAPDYVKEAGEYAPGSFLASAFSNRMFRQRRRTAVKIPAKLPQDRRPLRRGKDIM